LNAFADNTFFSRSYRYLSELIINMEWSIEVITKWLKQSGLKVYQTKTDACLFYKHNVIPIILNVGDAFIFTKMSINVLGVVFDSKLKWDVHISKVCNIANRSLNALKLIRKYFTSYEIITFKKYIHL
jgi:hypothetical protein